MQEIFEKIKERLKETENRLLCDAGDIGCTLGIVNSMENAIEIVNQVAEEYEKDIISGSKKPKYVSIGAYKQVSWERDVAIEQLHELGYEFGQKIEEEYCDYKVHFAPSTDIYFTTKCGHRHNGYLNGSRAYCGFCGKKIKVVE